MDKGRERNVMVCVTQQKTCERLIMSGYAKKGKDGKINILNVVNEDENFLYKTNEADALEYLFQVSKKAGADLMVIRAEDIIAAMADFAKENGVTHIVLGASPQSGDEETHPIVKKLKKYLKDVEYIIV